jgi:hypothetical protein
MFLIDIVVIIVVIYLIIGMVFLLTGLLTGLYGHVRKDSELSEVSGVKLFFVIAGFTITGWPLFVIRACDKLYRKMTEVSED